MGPWSGASPLVNTMPPVESTDFQIESGRKMEAVEVEDTNENDLDKGTALWK